MFTGIVEERGEVLGPVADRLRVASRLVAADVEPGASVAVGGVCLTVVERAAGEVSFDVSEETLSRTTLGALRPGDAVNLERPVTLASRLGGHLVQGHVDGVGAVTEVRADGRGGAVMRIALPSHLMPFVVEKGSLAIDGVSLTVAQLQDGAVDVALIPHTLAVTTMGGLGPGDDVNVEVDMIAKYVDRRLAQVVRKERSTDEG